jgi:hypothetical protein
MKNKIYQKIAFLLPRRLVYFCYIRFMGHATSTGEGKKITPDEMTFSKACELWEVKK